MSTFLPPGIGRASFTWEFCVLLLERKRKVSVLFISSVSQVPLTQNSHYAKAAYFGVACPECLHCNLIIFFGIIVSITEGGLCYMHFLIILFFI